MNTGVGVKRDYLWLFFAFLWGGFTIVLLLLMVSYLTALHAYQQLSGDMSFGYDTLIVPIMGLCTTLIQGALLVIFVYPKEQARQRCARGAGAFRHVKLVAKDITDAMPMTIMYRLARTYSLWLWGIVAVIVGPIGVGALIMRSLVALYFCLILFGIYALFMGVLHLWQWRRLTVASEGLYLRHWLRVRFIPWHEARLFAIFWESLRGEPSMYELASERTIIRWPTSDNIIATCSIGETEMNRVLAFISQQTLLPLYRLG